MQKDAKKIIFTEEDTAFKSSFLVLDLNTKNLQRIPFHEDLEDTNTIRRDYFRPFGITVHEDEIFVASNSKLCVFDKDTFEFKRSEHASINENTHELYSDSKTLWIVDTSQNRIIARKKTPYGSSERILKIEDDENFIDDGRFDPLEKVHGHKRPFKNFNHHWYNRWLNDKEPLTKWPHDHNHLNSVVDYNNSIFILESNIGHKLLKPSLLIEVDKNNFNIINKYKLSDKKLNPHSLVRQGDILWFLSTHLGYLHCYDLKSKKIIDNFFIDNPKTFWARGLALVNNLLYIGVGGVRSAKRMSQNKILVFDIIKKKMVDMIYIEGSYSAINQINTL